MTEYVSNCCSAPMNDEMHLCPSCFEGCEFVEIKEEDGE